MNGDDQLSGGGAFDALHGRSGDDWLDGGAGGDYLDGGADVDEVSYYKSDSGVSVDLADGWGSGGDAEGDKLVEIENITGSNYDDTLFGDDGANGLFGMEGNDHLDGKAGDDVLFGGHGDDAIRGGEGADYLHGGMGVDLAFYNGSKAGITVDLAAGTGSGGDAEGDTFVSIENVFGTAFADVLIGNSSANGLRGKGGQDTLTGGGGADNFIFGVTFDGLDGGLGPDADVIIDFSPAEGDKIDVSGVGKILVLNPNAQEFDTLICTFIGQAEFSGVEGELRYEHSGGDTLVSCDENGDGAADFEIVCLGTINFGVNDFFL